MLNSERFVLIIKVARVFDVDVLHFLVNTVTTTNNTNAVVTVCVYLLYAGALFLATPSDVIV